MQPRGVSELRDSEQTATSSASAEEFAEAMKELHSKVKQRLINQIRSINAEQISIGDNFSLKLVI
jgi:hypothetical protein